MQLIKSLIPAVMNSNKIGRDPSYDSKDFFFSDSHILTVSIISIFAVILAVLGVCFFFKICKFRFMAWEFVNYVSKRFPSARHFHIH